MYPSHHGMWGKWAPPLARSRLISIAMTGELRASSLSPISFAILLNKKIFYRTINYLQIFKTWKTLLSMLVRWQLKLAFICLGHLSSIMKPHHWQKMKKKTITYIFETILQLGSAQAFYFLRIVYPGEYHLAPQISSTWTESISVLIVVAKIFLELHLKSSEHVSKHAIHSK